MHDRALYLIIIILVVSFIIIVLYPVLFYIGLVLPLNFLLDGVRRVDRGDLEVNIPIQFNDEIGYISGLFNKMVVSIREKNERLDYYAANLELKVAERTCELENERLLLSEKNLIIEKDLYLARKIQLDLVPKKSPVEFMSSFYKPMELVGGDFYDFIQFRDSDKIGIFISDVSGHGISAALITSMLKATLLQAGIRKENPAELMNYINEYLMNQTAGNFITAFYGIYNQKNKSLLYANAGHPLPFIIKNDGITRLSQGKGVALAAFKNDFLNKENKTYQNSLEKLSGNSKLLLYTDGLTEARPLNGHIFFEEDSMMDVFNRNKNLPAGDFINQLFKSLIGFRGDDSFDDDVCLICLDVK